MNDEAESVDSSRLVRAAANQTLFREVNERIRDLNEWPGWQLDGGDWICECEDETCFERIHIALPDYERLRADGNRFALKPGHENLELEDVTDRNEQYVLVAKRGAGGVYATEIDPRAKPRASVSPRARRRALTSPGFQSRANATTPTPSA